MALEAPDQETIARLGKQRYFREWMSTIIRQEIATLIANREMFNFVNGLFYANPNLRGKPFSFRDWMIRVYAPAIAIGIRRQVDTGKRGKDKRVRSLYCFLTEIADHTHYYTETWIRLGLANQPDDWKQQHVDRLLGKGNKVLQNADVLADREQLARAAEPLKEFSDKRVAHREHGKLTTTPTFPQADAAVDLLEQLLRKYLQIVGEPVPESFIPLVQYPDDDLIFCTPWLITAGEGAKPR